MFRKIRVFLSEVRGELKRVSWPKREDLTRSTSVVIIMIVITACIIGVLDLVFNAVILKLLGV
jgi:preprotein translocase subunit SecE